MWKELPDCSQHLTLSVESSWHHLPSAACRHKPPFLVAANTTATRCSVSCQICMSASLWQQALAHTAAYRNRPATLISDCQPGTTQALRSWLNTHNYRLAHPANGERMPPESVIDSSKSCGQELDRQLQTVSDATSQHND